MGFLGLGVVASTGWIGLASARLEGGGNVRSGYNERLAVSSRHGRKLRGT